MCLKKMWKNKKIVFRHLSIYRPFLRKYLPYKKLKIFKCYIGRWKQNDKIFHSFRFISKKIKFSRFDSCLDLTLSIEGKIRAIFSNWYGTFWHQSVQLALRSSRALFFFFDQERIIKTTALFYYSKKYAN